MAIVPRELKNGRISYWVALKDQHRKPVWVHAGHNDRKAKSVHADIQRQIKEGTYSKEIKGRVTVRSWFDHYFTLRKNRTVANDKALVRDHVLNQAWFADKPIQDVRPRDMPRLVDGMRAAGKLGEKSISTVYGLVSGAFGRAKFEEVTHEDVSKVPRETLKLKRKTSKAKKRRPYLRSETLAILNAPGIRPDVRMWLYIAFFTGARKGEVCGRRWHDWIRDTKPLSALHVHTQYNDQPLKGDDDEDTRPRVVPVHPELDEALRQWWAEGFELVFQRKPTPGDFIVPTKGGTNHSRGSIYRAFQTVLRSASVANRTLHSSRHTFISVAQENGARGNVLEKVTHNASGELAEPNGTIDDYTTFGWRSLCEAVAMFDLEIDSEEETPVFSGGKRLQSLDSKQGPGRNAKRNQAQSEQTTGKTKPAKTPGDPLPDTWFDARQRRLLKFAEVDPGAAAPGLAVCRGLASALAGDREETVAALRDGVAALELAAGGRP